MTPVKHVDMLNPSYTFEVEAVFCEFCRLELNQNGDFFSFFDVVHQYIGGWITDSLYTRMEHDRLSILTVSLYRLLTVEGHSHSYSMFAAGNIAVISYISIALF